MSKILQVENLVQEFNLTKDFLDKVKFKNGHISLENILPYPPGICALAAGEEWTEKVLSYFLFLEEYGKEFPDFTPEIPGIHHDEKGEPSVWVSYPE